MCTDVRVKQNRASHPPNPKMDCNLGPLANKLPCNGCLTEKRLTAKVFTGNNQSSSKIKIALKNKVIHGI